MVRFGNEAAMMIIIPDDDDDAKTMTMVTMMVPTASICID